MWESPKSWLIKKAPLSGLLTEPPTDSNRRPLLTMRSETVAVDCHRLRIGFFSGYW